jgi:hypothetical protein
VAAKAAAAKRAGEAEAAKVRRYEDTPEQAQEKLNRLAALQRNADAKAASNAAAAAAAADRAAELNAIRNAHAKFSPSNLNAEVAKLSSTSDYSRALKKLKTPVIKAALIQKLTSMTPAQYVTLRSELSEELASMLDSLNITPSGVNMPAVVENVMNVAVASRASTPASNVGRMSPVAMMSVHGMTQAERNAEAREGAKREAELREQYAREARESTVMGQLRRQKEEAELAKLAAGPFPTFAKNMAAQQKWFEQQQGGTRRRRYKGKGRKGRKTRRN